MNDPEKRWVLKNPSHMTALDALMSVYPDALVVYTHRDPVSCIASSCSLSAATTAGHSETFVGGVVGHTQLDLWSRAYHAFHDARPRYDQAQFVDVDFADLQGDPVGTVRGRLRRLRAGALARGGGGGPRHRRRGPLGPRPPHATTTRSRTTGSPRPACASAFAR